TVRAAQPNLRYQSDAAPTDPRYREQYAHRITHAEEAWAISTGDRGIVVAVVGDGLELEHPDLRGNLWRNEGELLDGIDNDGNGFIDDIHGYDFRDGDGDPNTSEQHETSVAGVVGAEGGNGLGIAGIAWQVSLMAIRIERDSVGMSRAIHYAIDEGADVINLSMSSPTGYRDSMVTEALARAEAANVVVVASAGNAGNDVPRYPAAFPTVLGVAATDANDRRASYSCFGSWVDLAAPGDGVLTTYPGGRWDAAGGTSFAAPYVAGLAALARARKLNVSAAELRLRLRETGDTPISDVNIGRRVNAARLLGGEPQQTCGNSSCATLQWSFTGVQGNAWWLQVQVVGAGTPMSVEASVDGGVWRWMERADWGGYVASFFVPDGALVTFRATDSQGAVALSMPYRWPQAEPVEPGQSASSETSSPTPPAPVPEAGPSTSMGLVISAFRGNNWWLEATPVSSRAVSSLSVSIDGGILQPLRPTTWGPWVGGLHMPDGVYLNFEAVLDDGSIVSSPSYRWPEGTLAIAEESTSIVPTESASPLEASFSPARSNNWWLEVDISASAALVAVHVRVDQGAWVPLRPTTWGPWVEALYMPSGSILEFRARDLDGNEAFSPVFPWLP
ncbi:MAG: S8 family serine peptidase, partial [Myxococcota bacterium]